MGRDLLIVGCDAPYGAAIAARLARDGHGVVGMSYGTPRPTSELPVAAMGELTTADFAARVGQAVADFRPRAVVVLPRRPRVQAIADTEAEAFVAATDEALVGAETAAHYLLERRVRDQPVQLVLVSGWAAMGLPHASTAAAISGGLVGLARSWALELAPDGISVNAVVAGPGVDGSPWERAHPPIGRMPGEADVAQAVAFFVDPRSAAVNGQVLFVCGGLTPGIIPT